MNIAGIVLVCGIVFLLFAFLMPLYHYPVKVTKIQPIVIYNNSMYVVTFSNGSPVVNDTFAGSDCLKVLATGTNVTISYALIGQVPIYDYHQASTSYCYAMTW